MVGTKTNRTKIFGLFCKAKFCFNLRDKKKKVHRFPSNPTIRKIWLDYCENGEVLNPNDFLCSRHFKNSDYRRTKNSGMMLKIDAVPSVPLLDAAVASKQSGDQAIEDEADEKLLEMYDPQFDQQSLLDQIDGESVVEDLPTPNESEISSEYSVRIKEEQELIVDEDEDLYYENGYDEYIAENGHEYFEQIEEQYDEVVAEVPVAEETDLPDEQIDEVEESKMDQDDKELMKEQEVDPTIDPAVEEPKGEDDIEVDPAPHTKSPPPIKKQVQAKEQAKTPVKSIVMNDKVPESPQKANTPDILPTEASKEPEVPVVNGHGQSNSSEITGNPEPQVHETLEVFNIPEEKDPRRVTRSSEVQKLPEKKKVQPEKMTNGTSVASKESLTKVTEPPKKQKETSHITMETSIQDQTETEPTMPLHNSTPLPKDTIGEKSQPKKRKKRSLYVNPLSLAKTNQQTTALPEVITENQAKRPRVQPQKNKPNSNPASRSLPLTASRPINSQVRLAQPTRPPQLPQQPPPFRIRDPVLLETELTSLQSHYRRLKDENARLHQENARMFLVNSRLQSENGRLRASAILTNSKLKLENEKLRAAAELTKAERIREQSEAQLTEEETEALKHELDEMRLVCDDLREQLTSAMTAANNASLMPPPSEIGDNESTTGSLSKKNKRTLSDETLIAADKLLKIVGKDVYNKIYKMLAFPFYKTISQHRKKNPALFEDSQEEAAE